MKNILSTSVLLLAILIFASCKDPYVPDLKPQNTNVLVVEGFIDGGDSTVIQLSKVRVLTGKDTAGKLYVNNAFVKIEDEQNNSYPLSPFGNGRYAGLWSLNTNLKYRINIKTPDNKNYVSDFVSVKVSPPIDSVNLKVLPEGAQIYVNTHDANRKTTYYRWNFDETWEFHSTFNSEFYYDRNLQQLFERAKSIRVCWQSDHAKEILINSTAKLGKDEVSGFPIRMIPNGDFRLSVLYSINVKQYPMDTLGYNFFSFLKKNSEDLGTLFDPQPNNIRGNIHNPEDPSEIVIGYIGAGISTTKRTFFHIPWNYLQNCQPPYTVPKNKDSLDYYFVNGGLTPLYPEISGMDTTGWVGGENYCTDCTLRGTNVKPSFWP